MSVASSKLDYAKVEQTGLKCKSRTRLCEGVKNSPIAYTIYIIAYKQVFGGKHSFDEYIARLNFPYCQPKLEDNNIFLLVCISLKTVHVSLFISVRAPSVNRLFHLYVVSTLKPTR